MRVAFAVDNLNVGGTELNAVRTAERLVRANVELLLVTLQAQGPLRERYEGLGVPIQSFPLRSLHAPATLSQAWRLRRFLRATRVDVLHAHDTYSNVFAVPAARAAGTPLVLASRRWWHSPQRKHGIANRLAYRLADAVITNSPSVADLVVGEGVPRHRAVVVPNFLDDAAFEAPSRETLDVWRRDLGLDSGPVLGCVANLLPVKDHATLIGAVARIRSAGHPVQLVLVGDGPCRAELGALARRLGIGSAVSFAGRRPSQPSMHYLFDVSLLTSTSEGLPNSLLEAMAAGRPVVATDVGGVPDIVDDTVGRLVPAGSQAALGDALVELIRDEALRHRLGAEGRSRARRDHSAEGAMARLKSLYEHGPSRQGTGDRDVHGAMEVSHVASE